MDTSNNAAAANAATMTPVPVLQLDGTAPPATTAAHLYAQFCALVKRLKEPQMLTLCQALEHPAADGGPATNCVLVPRDAVDGEPGGPHVLACRLWRWPDVRYADELRRLPACPSAWDPVYECCNPSHWSRQMLEGRFVCSAMLDGGRCWVFRLRCVRICLCNCESRLIAVRCRVTRLASAFFGAYRKSSREPIAPEPEAIKNTNPLHEPWRLHSHK